LESRRASLLERKVEDLEGRIKVSENEGDGGK
jgi:hypothetical protein